MHSCNNQCLLEPCDITAGHVHMCREPTWILNTLYSYILGVINLYGANICELDQFYKWKERNHAGRDIGYSYKAARVMSYLKVSTT